MPYPMFDRSKLCLRPLAERTHDLSLKDYLRLEDPVEPFEHPDLPALADRIVAARERGSQVLLMMGAHVIKTGVSRFVIDLMQRGMITHVGMNGAGPIHDFELALVGGTTESVARYIRTGEFGLWQETGRLNDIAKAAVPTGLGFGEAIGEVIEEEQFPHRELSILAAGYRLRVPVTVHLGIGYDIIHEHPNCHGAALGELSYRDFLIMTQSVTGLQGGVMMCFGSAVMGPEVYLKALSMARNVAHREGRSINQFTTAVFDLMDLGQDIHIEAPKHDARYYFRPYKTILVRTVQDGGESFYFRGDHRVTMPNLWRLVVERVAG